MKLAELLDTKFISGEMGDQITDYLYDTQNAILQYHNAGDYSQRDYHLLRLHMFSKHLSEIESQTALFEEFKRELKKEEYNNYFGTRFEIDTAASLARKDISFDHPDPPDFVIDGREVIIECTTAHFSGGDRTIEEKIKQTVDSKSDKDYYFPNSALFIDLTNIFFHAASQGEGISEGILKNWVSERIELFNLEIGSVVLFCYIVEAEEGNPGMYHNYLRIDNPEADEELIEFLDEYWPVGSVTVNRPYHPEDP